MHNDFFFLFLNRNICCGHSMRRFFLTFVEIYGLDNIYNFMLKNFVNLNSYSLETIVNYTEANYFNIFNNKYVLKRYPLEANTALKN